LDYKQFLWFIILSLACYRLAQLIADDDGPLSVFGRIRRFVDDRAKDEQDRNSRSLIWQSISDGINCHYCVGIWVAIVLAVVYNGIQWSILVYIFAIAGLQSWLEGMKR